jgi:hypothetical protein
MMLKIKRFARRAARDLSFILPLEGRKDSAA